jgi:ferritin-like protein
MAAEGLHEEAEQLDPKTIDRHRAIRSLMEELEAVDWYDQRADATADPTLKKVLEHNRDEEKEHAAMTIEWLRRNDAGFDEQLREWLFTDKPIGKESEAGGDGGAAAGSVTTAGGSAGRGATSLGIGSLFGEVVQ